MNLRTRLPINGLNAIKQDNSDKTFDITDISQHQTTIFVWSVGDCSSSSEAKEVSFVGCS